MSVLLFYLCHLLLCQALNTDANFSASSFQLQKEGRKDYSSSALWRGAGQFMLQTCKNHSQKSIIERKTPTS